MLDTDYAEFFLSSARSVRQIETLEISHPSFSKVYRIVRNDQDGITARLENGALVGFEYYPLRIQRSGVTDDLDSSLQIDLGDLGQLVSAESNNVRAAATFTIKPKIVFRVYRSDDLNTILYGPYTYEATTFGITREGTSFTAQAPSLNVVITGEFYTLDRFPMLRAVL